MCCQVPQLLAFVYYSSDVSICVDYNIIIKEQMLVEESGIVKKMPI